MTSGASTGVEQEVAALQRQRFDATVAGDTATLERLIGDDLTYYHSTGRMDTKRSFIDSLATRALPYRAFEVSDQQVRVFGDAALVTSVIALTLRGANGEDTHSSRCTTAWARRDGQWQEVFWQATRLPD